MSVGVVGASEGVEVVVRSRTRAVYFMGRRFVSMYGWRDGSTAMLQKGGQVW